MKKFLFLILVLSSVAMAKTKKVTKKDEKSQVGTNFSFEGAMVRGKYQTSGEGVARVEDEKILDDLLGVRKNFNDRRQMDQSRW